jgi:alkane 1-monooxygenase
MSVNRPSLPMSAFVFASLLPLILLGFGLIQAAVWPIVALASMTIAVPALDRLLPQALADAPDGAEFPSGDALLVTVALGCLSILPLTIWMIPRNGFTVWQAVAQLLATGLWLGQVGHPAAHELIHRGQRWLFRLGLAVYCALLIGHHVSSHRLVHHRHVATPQDPATARRDEGFWRFALRSWSGGLLQGWQAETALRAGASAATGPHPYLVYTGGALLSLAVAAALSGWPGVALWAGLAMHAQIQIHLSDYVQHYGLVRRQLPDGRMERVGPQHSWNAAWPASASLMLNAPRHSDHHAHPARPYMALRLPAPADAPRLPWPLPVACLIALVPPLWRKRMHPHLSIWQHGADKIAQG